MIHLWNLAFLEELENVHGELKSMIRIVATGNNIILVITDK